MSAARLAAAASLVLLAAAARAEEPSAEPPAAPKLTVKGKLKGVKLQGPDGGMVMAFAFPDQGPPCFPATLRESDTEFSCEFKAPEPDAGGIVQVFGDGRIGRGGVVVLRESLRGEIDLGEVTFGDGAPVLVAGLVSDAAGKPAAGADVRVRVSRSPGRWMHVDELAAKADAEGRFSIAGEVRGAAAGLELGTSGRWQTEREVAFAPGAKDVRVVAVATSGVCGTVQLPVGFVWDDVVVQLRCPPGGAANARVIDVPTFSFGGQNDVVEFTARPSFRIEGIPPGTYELRLKFRGATRAIAVLKDLKVGEGDTDFPLLASAELPRRVRVHVVTADGAVAKGAIVRVRETGDRGKFRDVVLDANASGDVVFVGPSVEIAARGEGTDYSRTTSAAGEVDLVVPAGAPTTVTAAVPKGAPTSSATAKLCIALTWCAPGDVPAAAVDAVADDTDPRTAEKAEAAFGEDGTASAQVTVAGWYRVTLLARWDEARSQGTVGRQLAPVLVKGGKIAVTVPFDVGEIRSLLGHALPGQFGGK